MKTSLKTCASYSTGSRAGFKGSKSGAHRPLRTTLAKNIKAQEPTKASAWKQGSGLQMNTNCMDFLSKKKQQPFDMVDLLQVLLLNSRRPRETLDDPELDSNVSSMHDRLSQFPTSMHDTYIIKVTRAKTANGRTPQGVNVMMTHKMCESKNSLNKVVTSALPASTPLFQHLKEMI